MLTRSVPDAIGWTLVSLLVLLSSSYVTAELAYDEAVYLCLSREISESGLPLRRQFEDFDRFRLFQNSPPLVLYVASISQRLFPGRDHPARLIHLGLFVVPAYVFVWMVSRARFGPWAGIGALLSLLGSGSYLRATSQVALDVPLGSLALLVLFAFENACRAEGRARFNWSIAAAAGLVLATWTKYQAICICVAIAMYCVYLMLSLGRRYLRNIMTPLAFIIAGGIVAVAGLLAFFVAFAESSDVAHTVVYNSGRMSTGPLGPVGMLRAMLATATESVTRLGGALLLLSGLAVLVQRAHRGWLVILTSYVIATLSFNLLFFRLPGSGEHYLDSMVPALALLAGASVVVVAGLVSSGLHRIALGAVVFAIQFAGSPPPLNAWYTNSPRMAAAYIASRGRPSAGVLANSVAIEFYAGNPVRVIGFIAPDLLFKSLAGTSGDDISFVAVDRGVTPARITHIERQWEELLSRHFQVAPIDIPGMLVYERKRSAK
jgi:hypothetical protein